MSKYFDELSIAEEMEKSHSFRDGYTKTSVILYAKYLRYKKIKEDGLDYNLVTVEDMEKYDEEIESELKAFCEQGCSYFNYNVKFNDIDEAIKKSRHQKIRLPLPTPITKKEWEAICQVENDNYRRMLFVMLVDAKYHRYHNITIPSTNDKINFEINERSVFRVRMTESEICKAGGCKFKNAEENFSSLFYLGEAGLFYISEDKYRSWCITFVDITNTDILMYVSDYDILDLYYGKLNGNNVGTCTICGKLFKQSPRKPSIYCKEHKGYNKKQEKAMRTGICVDCGSEFTVAATDKNKCRCDNCQKEYRKQYKHLKYLSGKN